jgi:photosystem II stability/assembly factor-like uncharacterized protein
MPLILVATQDGLHTLDVAGRRAAVHLSGRAVTTIAPQREELWALLDGSEVWHASDIDRWTHLVELDHHRGTCIAATADDVFVGSSEARLFRVAAEGLEPVGSFDEARGRSSWYTPWGGPPDTRSIAEWDEAVYVSVHVGGILRSEDRGETWTPTIDIDADVHQVTTAEGLVLAACAGGLAVSADRGSTWTLRSDGLDAPYSRAIAVCGDAVLLSASNGPRGGRSAIYRGDLSGGTLERCGTGLPESFNDNIDSYCLDAPPEGPLAAFGTSDGRVFTSEDAGTSWGELASGLPPIQRVLVMP